MPGVITHTGQVRVEVGNLYEFMGQVGTRAGHIHKWGEYLYVITHTPFPVFDGEVGQDGNWWCMTQHGISPWTTLESCISRELLRPYKKPDAGEIIKRCADLVGNLQRALEELGPIARENSEHTLWDRLKSED